MLPKEAIHEFQAIYKKEFGEAISEAKATRRADKLLELYKAVLCGTSYKAEKVMNDHEQPNDYN
jgi:hypothetical protein